MLPAVEQGGILEPVLRPMTVPETRLLTFSNDLAEIPRLAEAVDAFCEPLAPSMEDLLALQLALEEAITNIINHGYGDLPAGARTFTVELAAVSATRIRATITDDAPAYDPLARPEVDVNLPLEDRAIGGLGVHLIKKLMHHTGYERRSAQNILTLERALNQPE